MSAAYSIDSNVLTALAGMVGKRCCLQLAGEYKSLTLGFGAKIAHPMKRDANFFRGEWEFVAYYSSWRIISQGEILCGSKTAVNSNAELEARVEAIQIGAVVSIEMLSKFDMRVTLDNDVYVDFMETSDDDDNLIDIFGPDHLHVRYKSTDGWHIGFAMSKRRIQ